MGLDFIQFIFFVKKEYNISFGSLYPGIVLLKIIEKVSESSRKLFQNPNTSQSVWQKLFVQVYGKKNYKSYFFVTTLMEGMSKKNYGPSKECTKNQRSIQGVSETFQDHYNDF